MIIGDPFGFAVIVDRVDEWNVDCDFQNGYLAISLDGKLFPDYMINTYYCSFLNEIRKGLLGCVDHSEEKERFGEMFQSVKRVVLPEEAVRDEDWSFLISMYSCFYDDLYDKDFYAFVVRRGDNLMIIAAKEKYYDEENSVPVIDEESVTATEISREEIDQMVKQMEEYIRQQGYSNLLD